MGHKPFQFGTNPMQEDSFEKSLIMQDKIDRRRVRIEQTLGSQGTDGGRFVQDKARRIAEAQVHLSSILDNCC